MTIKLLNTRNSNDLSLNFNRIIHTRSNRAVIQKQRASGGVLWVVGTY
jgi:hypothetical protein